MTLLEAVRGIDSFSATDVIYAAKPWTASSEVVVAPEPSAGGAPRCAEDLRLRYFLEVFLAREILEGWVAGLDREPSLQEKCARLIEYARTDA